MPDFGLSSSSGFLWCVIVILGRAAFLFCQTSYGVWGFIVCHLDDVGGYGVFVSGKMLRRIWLFFFFELKPSCRGKF